MAPNRKKCPNGHQYDANIYGDSCPFCPNPTQINSGAPNGGGRTQINPVNGDPTVLGGGTSGATIPINNPSPAPNGNGGHTVIRPVGGSGDSSNTGRKVVGVLVSYSVNPCGEVYKLYEGRNTLGRDITNDISFPSDNSVSSLHLVIVYREADGRFLMEDQLTSNGTWLNGNFAGDRVTLNSGDIIVVGGVKLAFLAVPMDM